MMGVGVGVLHCEGFGRALGGRWRVVRVGSGSLIYRQIKWLHCSGYLLVDRYVDEIRIRSSFLLCIDCFRNSLKIYHFV